MLCPTTSCTLSFRLIACGWTWSSILFRNRLRRYSYCRSEDTESPPGARPLRDSLCALTAFACLRRPGGIDPRSPFHPPGSWTVPPATSWRMRGRGASGGVAESSDRPLSKRAKRVQICRSATASAPRAFGVLAAPASAGTKDARRESFTVPFQRSPPRLNPSLAERETFFAPRVLVG